MKFLVIRRPTKEGLAAVFERPGARDQLRQALERGPEIVRDLKERGKLEAIYALAGELGGVAILDVDSHEELTTLLLGLPLASVADNVVVPLADFGATASALRDTFAEAVAAR